MEEQFDYIENEYNFVRDNFNLEEILEFQKDHTVEIIRGSDWQYECYIDRNCYYISLTPLYTLLLAIKTYNENRL